MASFRKNKMMNYCLFIFIFFSGVFCPKVYAQDTLTFKGQLSAYTHLNAQNELPWWSGARYLPQLNYEYRLPNAKLIDFEVSANLYGHAGLKPFESAEFNGDIKPYRVWARYSSPQFELRTGLQKINFGSASLLRPLMWFDQIDPRDPLRLTDGVWGVLARYYFLNNVNIWLWGLYGNDNRKGWETFASREDIPEFGGRVQLPAPKGEFGLSYHRRTADGRSLSRSSAAFGKLVENRFGFDVKFDMEIGWWIEASWSAYRENTGLYSNQEIINLGMDYTFGLGNGMAAIYEQLLASYDENPFRFGNTTTFSLISLSYPVNLFDNVSAIFYYDWTNNKAYNFLNWQRQSNRFTYYLIGYVNPKQYDLPAQGTGDILYAGSGIQLMVAFNH